jgi:glycosyltransferase involved in cell wall biosynthesis
MRIAVVSTPFLAVPPRDYGGTELVVYELVEGLLDRGHKVTLFAPGCSTTRAELASLYLKPQWPPHPLAELNHASWAMAKIAESHFDLAHAHTPAVLAMGRMTPHLPVIYTIHHARDEKYSDYYRHFPGVQYVAISHRQKRLEIPLPKCEVIYHGLDPGRFEWTAKPGNQVCFIGRFSGAKGPHLAIDAAGLAGLPIYVAGETHPDGEQFAEQELKPRLRLPHVHLLGCIGVSKKVPLLRDARALLSPLDWEEPFGLALIEAMLSGCPVVAFPRGSAPELIEEGVTGFLASSLGQMAQIIRPGGVLDTFDRGLCRRRAIERFSRDRLVTDHLRLYQRVLDESAHEQKRRRHTSQPIAV